MANLHTTFIERLFLDTSSSTLSSSIRAASAFWAVANDFIITLPFAEESKL